MNACQPRAIASDVSEYLRGSTLAGCSAMACGVAAGVTLGLLLHVLMRGAQRSQGAESGGYPYTSRAPLL